MKHRSFIQLMLVAVLATSLSVPSVIADPKKGKQNPSKSQVTTLVSSWILPNSKSKSPTLLQVGRSLPIKFTLVENTSLLKDTNMVSLSYVKLTSCELSAQPAAPGQGVVIFPVTQITSATASPTASPTATTSPSESPSAAASPTSSDDGKEVVLRNEKGTFQFNWKVPKSLSTGCYRLIAQKGSSISIIVQSPVLRVKVGR